MRKPDRYRFDDVRKPDFEFCVSGRPVSAQAKNRLALQSWKRQVGAAAIAAWPGGRDMLRSDLRLHVTHYAERRIADRDNLLKPIQDALQRVVYRDDGQIVDTACNWRNINGSFTVRHVFLSVAVSFSIGVEFLHVRVWTGTGEEDLG